MNPWEHQAMFQAMDLNGDGLVSHAELKADMKRVEDMARDPSKASGGFNRAQ